MRTRLKILLPLFAIFSVSGIFWWIHRPPENRLLVLATRVPGITLPVCYSWRTDHDLLVFRPVGGTLWAVFQHDVKTQSDIPIPVLTELFRKTGGAPNSVKVSPDGKWMLWAGVGKFIYAATAEGGLFRQWHYGQQEIRPSLWLADSQHFAKVSDASGVAHWSHGTHVVVRDITRPATCQSLPLVDVNTPVSAKTLSSQKPGSLFYAERYTDLCYILSPDRAEVQSLSLPPTPDSEQYWDNTYSIYHSEGTRVLWKLCTTHNLTQSGSYVSGGLWVSRIDGAGMREIGGWAEGYVLVNPDAPDKPHDFRWVPGGKQISFENSGSLYTVPAQ